MKAEKEPLGIKHKIRVIAVILIAMVFISAFLANSMLNQPSTNQIVTSQSQPKAAIVDHLSLTFPNQNFIQTATNTLKQAGYSVDYYPGENVTVEFYRNLPTHGYSLIILRVHSSASPATEAEGPVILFTSEPYSTTKHVYEQLTDQLCGAAYSTAQAKKGIEYFGIGPLFVTQSMNGRFQNTIIIVMGCEGLSNTEMAKAFVQKGAKAYISWSASVSADHTDQATTCLLQHLITEKQTIKQAVDNTMNEIGPDPVYESMLDYYPLKVGEQTIENINGKS
jgi:hypothetical protein